MLLKINIKMIFKWKPMRRNSNKMFLKQHSVIETSMLQVLEMNFCVKNISQSAVATSSSSVSSD
jgi:hypothetical protein